MKSKKSIALILALLMILSAFTLLACDKKGGNGGNGSDINDVETDNETTEYVKEKYSGLDYNGYKFRIFAITPGEHYQNFIAEDSTEIWYEEDNADALQHAVFTRNLLTEELLNVTITPIWGGSCYTVTDQTKTLVKAGGDEIDVVHNSHFKALQVAMEKYYWNLNDLESFDVSEPWWDQEYVDTFTFRKNQLYTICGDYLTLDDYATPIVYYNKNVVANLNLEDPADLVDAGTWTIDNMMDLASKATFDLSGDGKMDENDSWGLLDNGNSLVHFIEGCNCPLTALDEEGVPQVTVEKESFVNTVQYVYERLSLSTSLYEQPNDDDLIIIKDDRALFYREVLGSLYNFRDMEGDFSFLPPPKLNEDQENYTSIADGIWCTALSVPITVTDTNMIGTVLDVLGGMSTDTVDKALYEIVLGPKLFREKRTVDMLQYCLAARDYDWAKDIPWAYPLYGAINEQGVEKTFSFASKLQSNIKVVKVQLKGFTKLLPKY